MQQEQQRRVVRDYFNRETGEGIAGDITASDERPCADLGKVVGTGTHALGENKDLYRRNKDIDYVKM